MYDFHRDLQQLDVGEFQASQVVPWDYNQYQGYGYDVRACFGIFPFFSCFGCGGCGGCGGCFGFGRCGGCGHCGGCGRCHR
ncbi:heterocycloanthracin/sonorensin family bacteriocin [Gottfriedia luciferensis]|uniref:heterocycloanthracin/sonorensin family bacteriocin n=1 Tax=Gottfriedia luciferensis TaxID=178774 RepID=UPI000B432D9E|nr:heterocycloanthracin/sonorensin family bacteriocin [Gottfriedia luciferensis]